MPTGDVATILVVCLGNICRSPFAEVALQEEARRRCGEDVPVRVRSAGVRGLGGYPATEEMRDEAAARGLDLSQHRGAGVDAASVADADLVLAMTESQRDALVRLAPSASDRTFTLKELARLVAHVEPPEAADPVGRVRQVAERAHGARPRTDHPARPEDVADPYGASRATYRRTADEITDLVDAVAPHLFGGG